MTTNQIPCRFCSTIEPTNAAPLRPIRQHHVNWHVWRAILDRIISHSNYCYGAPNSKVLLRLAEFAGTQLALFNHKQWQTHDLTPDFTGRFDGHTGR